MLTVHDNSITWFIITLQEKGIAFQIIFAVKFTHNVTK